MSSSFGDSVRISIFGESHGEAIGVVLDNLPAGCSIDEEQLALQMARRAPGRDLASTPRSEGDQVRIVSGLLNGKTTGAPLCGMIENTNTRSSDYESLRVLPRPGHADYTGAVRYNGANDVRGGGHFSGRLTASLTFAGAVCRQILSVHGIRIGAHALRIASISGTAFDPVEVPDALLERLSTEYFSLIDRSVEAAMREEIEEARKCADSVGGVVECAVTGVPAGIGSPMFYGVENVLSSILFGVPAVKGVEFGDGFAAASLHGSENNDAFTAENGQVKTRTNHCGGILGGITTGMPLILRAAFKPTPSIGREQNTVNLNTLQNEPLVVHGRHDPCIVPRAIPVVEAAVAVGLVNLMAERGRL
ncbi:chorismate synthase [Faecalispora jeddahensis]|uniref:chorismate synthase n=1 Tax=Faecalispora jeddahensis TaxID=1414721 RepID=UPI0027B8BFD6|nr:chorismate synthase [Faecalispora jeddahensis]